MSLRLFGLIGFLTFFCLSPSGLAYAQDNSPSRGIPSDEFANGRPQSLTGNAATSNAPTAPKAGLGINTPAPRRKETYKPARTEPLLSGRRPTPKPKPHRPSPRPKPMTVEDVGVTLWRLRPPRGTDTGPKMNVEEADGRKVLMTPERVGANTRFRSGDRVRLAVEAKRSGYLYVINVEMYANERRGKHWLLFPFPADTDKRGRLAAGQDNQVGAGLLVDIPDQSDNPPYFVITPGSPEYAGELILLIFSPTPLEGLKLVGPEQEIVNEELLAEWEDAWGADVELYMKESGEGEGLTTAEQQAGCGAKTRQLTRPNPSAGNAGQTPCGKTRRLTRVGPLPQSIYRVSVPEDQPVMIPVRLSVRD